MSGQNREKLNKSVNFSNMVMGVGILLMIVPTGLTLVSIVISDDETFWYKLISLGWAFFVSILLLPIGMGLFFYGLGKLTMVKRALKSLDDADDD